MGKPGFVDLTDNTNTFTFQNQIEALQNNENGLIERKLIIYQIEQHRYKIGLMDNEWQNSTKLYKKYKEKNTPFEIVLIGLDGGIKLRQSNLLTCEALFSIIDVMPMRREEIKNRRY